MKAKITVLSTSLYLSLAGQSALSKISDINHLSNSPKSRIPSTKSFNLDGYRDMYTENSRRNVPCQWYDDDEKNGKSNLPVEVSLDELKEMYTELSRCSVPCQWYDDDEKNGKAPIVAIKELEGLIKNYTVHGIDVSVLKFEEFTNRYDLENDDVAIEKFMRIAENYEMGK